jgi:NTE family protein
LGVAFYVGIIPVFAQSKLPASQRPKIGVALSGGGAKGIAHIGVLKAIEDAGLKVDYITGTSMGAIIGGFYALGYSADQLKDAISKEDWDALFANKTSLDRITMEEKEEFSKYMVELPFKNKKIQSPQGFIDSHSLLLEFSRLASRNYANKKFDRFPIPFQCFATDVASGKIVALDSGNLAQAIRASMSIPTVFAPVRKGDQLLVDGGLLHNLPASDLKPMGASIIIGVNLSTGLMEVNQLSSFGHIIFQSMAFLDAQNREEELKYCNILIEPTLTGFNAGSFKQTPALLKVGEAAGIGAFPQLKRLADSLNAIYEYNFTPPYLQYKDSVHISSVEIHGLEGISKEFLLGKTGLQPPLTLSLDEIPDRIAHAMSTNYFAKINYELELKPDRSTQLHLYVDENPTTYIKGAVNYNTYGGIGLIANLTLRNKLWKSSRFLISTRIAQNFRSKMELFSYVGKKRLLGANFGVYYDVFDLPTYNKLVQTGMFFVNYVAVEQSIQRTININHLVGLAARAKYFESVPQIVAPAASILTKSVDLNVRFFFGVNTLNRSMYPKKGKTIDVSFIGFLLNNVSKRPFNTDSVYHDDYNYLPNYYRFSFNWAQFIPIAPKFTFQSQIFSGLTFNKPQNPLNAFIVGGLTNNFRNQIQFVGLKEFELFSNNFQMLQVGFRYEVIKELYLLGRYNLGSYSDTVNEIWNNVSNNKNFVSGYGLTIAYASIFGPIEITAMHCEQLHDFRGYLNVGFNF